MGDYYGFSREPLQGSVTTHESIVLQLRDFVRCQSRESRTIPKDFHFRASYALHRAALGTSAVSLRADWVNPHRLSLQVSASVRHYDCLAT